MNETVRRCHNAGLRCCVHAIGDRAFDMALGAYETPSRNRRAKTTAIASSAGCHAGKNATHGAFGHHRHPNIAIGYYVGDAILGVGENG